MCKVGDIIVISDALRSGKELGKHSFIVLSLKGGEIRSMPFDMVCTIMSSFDGKGERYKARKLSYPDNMEFSKDDINVPYGNDKEGFIKPGVLFYFNRERIDYEVIGNISIDLYNKIIEFINKLDGVEEVFDNL